jgi:hypothetical protein
VVEVAFMFPLLFFLFVGVFDMGFYSYALISTQNAARAAALYTSSSVPAAANQPGACCFALKELQGMGNVAGPAFNVRSCACVDIDGVTDASPVGVRAERLDASSAPPSADGSVSSRVTVRYRSIRMIPIPGVLAGQHTFTRAVEARVRSF